jgi:hypothetical protein
VKNKESKVAMRKNKATVSIEFDAPNREDALRRAHEVFEGKDVKIKLQEASLAWLTLPDAPTS